jgi:hypothetical protein
MLNFYEKALFSGMNPSEFTTYQSELNELLNL